MFSTSLVHAETLTSPTSIPEFNWTTQIAIFALRYDVDPALAIKIAECESGLDPDAVNVNKNSSRDIGIFQWNRETWRSTLLKKGWDIYDPIDNIEAGVWMLKTQGVQPWRFSRGCWKSYKEDYRPIYPLLANR